MERGRALRAAPAVNAALRAVPRNPGLAIQRRFPVMSTVPSPKISSKAVLNQLRAIVGDANVLTGSDTDPYAKGYRYGGGTPRAVVRPRTTGEVSALLAYCNKHRIAVVPQGGNTGLVGASTADKSSSQIIINTSLLNKDVFVLDADAKTVTLGAGHVLDQVNERLESKGLMLPIDVGSSKSCQIGAMAATNTAGTCAGGYGNMASRTLTIKVVTADGTIREEIISHQASDTGLLQDNSFPHPSSPFLGSGGAFGIITEVKVQLAAIPKQEEAAVIVPRSRDDIPAIRAALQEEFGPAFVAFEGMSREALQLASKHAKLPNLLGDDPAPYALLAGVTSSQTAAEENLEQRLQGVMERLLEEGVATNVLMGKTQTYWDYRHNISDALAKEARESGGVLVATDIAVPIDKLGAFMEKATAKLGEDFPHLDITIAPFGHEKLGAVHYNIVCRSSISAETKRAMQEAVYDVAVYEFGGTFSAEHGIGPHNAWAYRKYISLARKAEASEWKRLYDPNGIMNPNAPYGLSSEHFAEPSAIRDALVDSLTKMYTREVPKFATLLKVVAETNAEENGGRVETPPIGHGAVRVSESEVGIVAPAFAILGLYPVNYYNLTVAGIPVHSTAFRPLDPDVRKNLFRMFASVVRPDALSEDKRKLVEELIAGRSNVDPRLAGLIETHREQGGLTEVQAHKLVEALVATFQKKQQAVVSRERYDALMAAHPIAADVAAFGSPHINHLTPVSTNIDACYKAMQKLGIPLISSIQGPPWWRKVPLFLNQASFIAPEEGFDFEGKPGTHTARFGEWETKDGVALTPKGRELYNQCMAKLGVPESDPGYKAALGKAFEGFPDDLEIMRKQGLVFITYHATEKGLAAKGRGTLPSSIDALIEGGYVGYNPIRYDDFLPVSAAGIFRSNMQEGTKAAQGKEPKQEQLERALGCPILDGDAMYAARQARSALAVAKQLGVSLPNEVAVSYHALVFSDPAATIAPTRRTVAARG